MLYLIFCRVLSYLLGEYSFGEFKVILNRSVSGYSCLFYFYMIFVNFYYFIIFKYCLKLWKLIKF